MTIMNLNVPINYLNNVNCNYEIIFYYHGNIFERMKILKLKILVVLKEIKINIIHNKNIQKKMDHFNQKDNIKKKKKKTPKMINLYICKNREIARNYFQKLLNISE